MLIIALMGEKKKKPADFVEDQSHNATETKPSLLPWCFSMQSQVSLKLGRNMTTRKEYRIHKVQYFGK